VIEKVIGLVPVDIVPIIKSPWVVVEVKRKRDVDNLVEQGAVYDPVKKILIVFRRPTFKATRDRVFEILNVKFKTDLEDIEKELINGKSRVVSMEPPKGEWSPLYEGRIIWKTEAPDTRWRIPVRMTTSLHTKVDIRQAPLCGLCHSDDHHSLTCQWRELFPHLEYLQSKSNRR
jgi:hypothetical protein